jgi:hypothetical protein
MVQARTRIINELQAVALTLERQPRADLNFAAWGHWHCDGSELRFVDIAVRSSEIRLVQGVEGFAAEFEPGALRQAEVARDCDVHGLKRRPVDGVASYVAEGVGRWCGECSRIEPFVGRARPGAEDGLSGVVGANGILPKDSAGIRSIAEH